MMLVSAIMPTRGRPELSRRCVEYWRAQTWQDTELVIVDDQDDPSFPHGVDGARVRYFRRADRLSIGAKRNLAAHLATGEVICQFDSDDYYAPDRIRDQVLRLTASGKTVTGYRNIRFTDGVNWWLNTNWPGGHGASLCYRRSWWETHPFPEMQCGEDWYFVETAMRANEFLAADAGEMMYATIHADNTSPRVIGEGWISCSTPDSTPF
jgi:glycosyltransferase involved in cell wall biosynthesis